MRLIWGRRAAFNLAKVGKSQVSATGTSPQALEKSPTSHRLPERRYAAQYKALVQIYAAATTV